MPTKHQTGLKNVSSESSWNLIVTEKLNVRNSLRLIGRLVL